MTSQKKVLRVLISGAAGRIANSLVPQLCTGLVFGTETHIELVLLDLECTRDVLQGFKMEIEDCCFDLVQSVTTTHDESEAFRDIDYAVLVGGYPRKKGMERKDLLLTNSNIFVKHGQSLQKYGKESTKTLVVANPANVNCFICSQNAPKIKPENFMCLTRLDYNRFEAQLVEQLESQVEVRDTQKGITIFGDHSKSMVPWLSEESIFKSKLDEKTLKSISSSVKTRGEAIISKTNKSSACSAARAICHHLKDWHQGTPDGQWTTMGVYFECNPYQFTDNKLFSSCPVTVDKSGQWHFVENLNIEEPHRTEIETSLKGILSDIAMINNC